MGRGPRKSGFPLLWGEEGQGSGVELSPQAEAEQSGLWPDEVEGRFYFLPARLGIVFPLAQRGPKPLFLLSAKEKAVLDSEKEKVDQWKSWGGAVQPGVGFVLLWYPSGEGLWGIPFVSGGLRLSDPWSLLRHCR